MTSDQHFIAVKDNEAAHPVASAWRHTLRGVVRAIAHGDFAFTGIAGVSPLSPLSERQITGYLEEFGQALTDLPEETWKTSCAQWYEDHWGVIVDLWTIEGGRSDMVLAARVFEDEGGYRFVIDSVHVP